MDGADVAEDPVEHQVGGAAQAGVLASGGRADVQVLRHERVAALVHAAAVSIRRRPSSRSGTASQD